MSLTPGEWKAEELLDRWAIRVGGYVIASVYKDANKPGEAEGKAKLMAAAPDLLKACKEILLGALPIGESKYQFEKTYIGGFRVAGNRLEALVVAIAKATE